MLFLQRWAAFSLLAALWLGFYAPFLVNVPRSDDLVSLLPFLCDWRDAGDLAARVDLLFSQYFSHRIVATRLAGLAVHAAFGHLHLVALQAIGLILWLGLAAWCSRAAMDRHGSAAAGLPVALLLLLPLGYTNIVTAMQAVGNHAILVLALAACVLVRRDATPARLALAFGAAAAAMLSAANGLVLPVLLTTAVLLQGRWRAGVSLAVASTVLVLVWFRNFDRDAAPFAVDAFAANALVMVGAPFNLGRLPLPATAVLGAVVLLATLAALWRRRLSAAEDPAALFTAFLLGSVALAAAGRVGWGAEYMQQDRYSPYGLLLVVCVWLLAPPLPAPLRRAAFVGAALAAAVVAATAYVRIYPALLEHRRWALAVAVNHPLGVPMAVSEREIGLGEQARAIGAGLLRLPAPGTRGTPSLAALREAASAPAPAGDELRLRPGFDSGRGVLVLRPVRPGQSLAAEFALATDGVRLVLLPAIAERETYARAARLARVVNPDRDGFLWPFSVAPQAPLRFLGLAVGPGGQCRVLWTGRMDLP